MDMDKKLPEAKKKTLPKKPAIFLTIDNNNLIGWLMSCFIVCGCMFFLGVMVGRNTVPLQFDVDRIEDKLSDLQESVLKQKKPEKTKTDNPETIKITDINEISELPIVHEDILDQLKDKGKEPELYEQYVPPILTPKYSKTPPPKNTPKQAKKEPASKLEKQVMPSKPLSKSEPEAELKPEIHSKTPVVSKQAVKPEKIITKKSEEKPTGPEFAIQVASLKDHEKARLLMNKFREKGYPAFCQESEVNGTTMHRVRIGPYPERALAKKDQTRLKSAGVDCLIISTE